MISLPTIMLLASSLASPTFAHYALAQDYTGAAFFEGFDWFTDVDPTKGHVRFVDKDEANSTGIAGLMSGGLANNAVYMAMNTVDQAPEGRASIRVSSSKSFNRGLIITDIVHMPGGICGTWPAFWLVGPDWPTGGEIDILEGVNDQASNKMVLHTGPGVSVAGSDNSTFTGEVLTSNCDVSDPSQDKNAGCGISDADNTTYGAGFNSNGGGLFATEVTSSNIKIWFFPRDQVPSDITAGNPAPGEKTWGLPRAAFSGDFKVDDHFRDMKLVFDTTLCGEWAGEVWANTPSCAALAPTCEQYVSENPEAFKGAYWAVNSLQVFETEDANQAEPNDQPGDTAPDAVPQQQPDQQPDQQPAQPQPAPAQQQPEQQQPQPAYLKQRSPARQGGAVLPALPRLR